MHKNLNNVQNLQWKSICMDPIDETDMLVIHKDGRRIDLIRIQETYVETSQLFTFTCMIQNCTFTTVLHTHIHMCVKQ